jgi:outer membrane autotransporter protein
MLLTFGPDALNTQATLRQSGSSLQSVMRSRLGDLLTTANYDCRYFDERGVCLSVFARNGDSSVTNSTNAVVIGSLRLTDNFRLGGFFDTRSGKQTIGGVSAQDRSIFGGFVAFDQNTDGTGFSAKVSAATKDGKVDINRNGSDADFTESGSGKAKLNASTVSGEIGFGLRTNGLLITPYLGFSHSKVTRSAYTETAGEHVVYPVSYDKFKMRPESGTLGIKLQGKLDESVGYNLGAGVTGGLSRGMSGYAGTSSIIGMSSFRIDLPKGSSTGGFASAGLSYRIAKGVYVSGNVSVRQDPYYNKTGTYSFIGLSMGI